MVVHVVEVLLRAVDEVVVVSSEALALPPLDARVVRDREPERGPLAGIREGLAHVGSELAYVTGTDAPFLTPAFVRALLSHDCAAAPEVDGHVQTLAAVYPRAALSHAEALLEAGRPRPLFLLEAADYRRVAASELPDLDSVRGFNTPGEYLRAVRDASEEPTAILELPGMGERKVPIGTLAEILSRAPGSSRLLDGDRVSEDRFVSLDGQGRVRDGTIPIGPGERVIVTDAPAAD